jgi:hypothetical protein
MNKPFQSEFTVTNENGKRWQQVLVNAVIGNYDPASGNATHRELAAFDTTFSTEIETLVLEKQRPQAVRRV